MMKLLRHFAEHLGLYDRIRYSRPYEWALRYRNPAYLAHLERDTQFYRRALAGLCPRLIFDVGANTGDKTLAFRHIAMKVVCFEPDPRCVAALRTRFRGDQNVTIEPLALGASSGSATFHIQAPASAYNTLSGKHSAIYHQSAVQTEMWECVVTLDQMIATHAVPDFLKVDVEGFEEHVFAGLSQPISVVNFEANLPDFAGETVRVVEKLMALDPTTSFNALRSGEHDWIFPEHQDERGIQLLIARPECQSFEIFAFRVRAPIAAMTPAPALRVL